jgi:hypothetical protein
MKLSSDLLTLRLVATSMRALRSLLLLLAAAAALFAFAAARVSSEARRVRRELRGAGPVPGQRQEWFGAQRLDHFDPTSNATFAQRYWVLDRYWTAPSGPVLFLLCGEYTCPGVMPSRLFPVELAQDFGALVSYACARRAAAGA